MKFGDRCSGPLGGSEHFTLRVYRFYSAKMPHIVCHFILYVLYKKDSWDDGNNGESDIFPPLTTGKIDF